MEPHKPAEEYPLDWHEEVPEDEVDLEEEVEWEPDKPDEEEVNLVEEVDDWPEELNDWIPDIEFNPQVDIKN